MSQSIVIRGTFKEGVFIPSDPLPAAEGPAKLLVFPQEISGNTSKPTSIFDLFGQAATLRSLEDISEQIREEREAWDEA
jgi:hypothetical protein